MLSSRGVPDDERKGRRLGDETKGRIADLASGWTMDGDAPPVPEPPIQRDASGPTRRPPDAPRRKAKTLPPPPPGSAARKALEDKIAELRELHGEPDAAPAPPTVPAGKPPAAGKPPPRPGKSATGSAPVAGKPRAQRGDAAVDLAAMPEADKTKENRGAVGIKHDRNASITANAASGTIGETPPPIFDRAAIAAGPRGALAGPRTGDGPAPASAPARDDAVDEAAAPGRLGSPPGDAIPPRLPDRSPSGRTSPAGTGPLSAPRGTPRTGAILDRLSPAGSGGSGPAVAGADETAPPLPAPPAALVPPVPGAAASAAGDASRLPVPLGEFDRDQTILEQDKLRIAHAQATIKRDAAGALLGLADPAPARLPAAEVLFDEPTRRSGDAARHDSSSSSTVRFERGDPTFGDDRGDATALSGPAAATAAPTGTLRSSASLPRRRGLAGDVRYIATVVLGLRSARRELAEITARQATRQQSRRHHLITLGRAAVTADGFEHPALGAAREQLATIEDERSQHASHVVAADAELARVRRDREAKAKQYAADVAALDTELASLARKLEPLEKEVVGIRKRGVDLHDALRRIDAKIAATEASRDSDKGGKLDRAEIQAELATLRAERKAIQSDEPVIAGQLDAMNPRIAALEAARAEARRRRTEIDTAEHDDQRRVEELLAAIGAKRKVVDRAAADAEARRDKILFKLGERLYVDRPGDLTAELAPIDEIDLELGSADRRIMELREIVTSVDRWKLARGIALIAVVIAAAGALAAWLAYLRT